MKDHYKARNLVLMIENKGADLSKCLNKIKNR